ncbi:MAG TPA: hypothetical protein VK961_17440 [Chthoniobacter sp.]|nr:hypothetical protein [Chthoniobacter sp.]
MSFVLVAYFGSGVAVYVALWLLFKRNGFGQQARDLAMLLFCLEGIIGGLLLWPIGAVIAGLEYWRLVEKRESDRKRAKERAKAEEREGKYVDLNMDALLEAQRRLLNEVNDRSGRKE